MYILSYISGFLLIFYSLIVLSFNVSISSRSSNILFFKDISAGLVVLGMVCAVMLILNGLLQKKRKNEQKLEKILVRQLIAGDNSVMLLQLISKSGFKESFVNKFIRKRIKGRTAFSLTKNTTKTDDSTVYILSFKKNEFVRAKK